MYLGRIVESADSDTLFASARHPYTRALLSAVPVPDPAVRDKRERILLRGDLPCGAGPSAGCLFRGRCPRYQDDLSSSERLLCEQEDPQLETGADAHAVACHHPGG
jgi:oligopeptide/dipeptide ABC transporter ATP-binding protein